MEFKKVSMPNSSNTKVMDEIGTIACKIRFHGNSRRSRAY